MPIDDGHEIHKAVVQANVRNVRTPDLIAASNGDTSQEIRKHLVLRMAHTEPWFWIHGFQPHLSESSRRTRFSLTGWPNWRKHSVILPTP